MPRLFVAVWPPDDVLDRLAELPRPEIKGLRWTTRDQWHVTLRFLGQVPEVEPVVEALSGVRGQAVTAVLGPGVARFGRRVLHVPVSGLRQVAEDVVAATAHLGSPPEDRPFAGHVTLARVAKGSRVNLEELTGTPLRVSWPVGVICVVESRLARTGARYEVRATHPLERVSRSISPCRPTRGGFSSP